MDLSTLYLPSVVPCGILAAAFAELMAVLVASPHLMLKRQRKLLLSFPLLSVLNLGHLLGGDMGGGRATGSPCTSY